MKKRRKGRLLALMLALVMAFTMVPPVSAKATDSTDSPTVINIGFDGNPTIDTEINKLTWTIGETNVEVIVGGDGFTWDSNSNTLNITDVSQVMFTLSNNFDSETMEVVHHDNNASPIQVDGNAFTLPSEIGSTHIEVRAKNNNSGGGDSRPEGTPFTFDNALRIQQANSGHAYEVVYLIDNQETIGAYIDKSADTDVLAPYSDTHPDGHGGQRTDQQIYNNGSNSIKVTYAVQPNQAQVFIDGQSSNISFDATTHSATITSEDPTKPCNINLNYGSNQNPGPGDEAIIKLSAYTKGGTWTGHYSYNNDEDTFYYDKQWVRATVSLNNEESGNGKTKSLGIPDNELNAVTSFTNFTGDGLTNYDLTRQKVEFTPYADDPATPENESDFADVSFSMNWSYEIEKVVINGDDFTEQLVVAETDPAKTIFHDRYSYLSMFGDQNANVTIKGVPYPRDEQHTDKWNESDEAALPVFNIEVDIHPNPETFIGNFLWTKDDYFAPIAQGGLAPSRLYIGHSDIIPLEVYYEDGTGEGSTYDFLDTGVKYKRLALDKSVDGYNESLFTVTEYKDDYYDLNEKGYTLKSLPSIHWAYDRMGEAQTKPVGTVPTFDQRKPDGTPIDGANKFQVATSEMVMPAGSWVKMKIVPEYGYQVLGFSGVNRDAGNVKVLSEAAGSECVFLFKVDEGNFHIGADIAPYDDEVDDNSTKVKVGTLDASDTIDAGTAELEIADKDLSSDTAAITTAIGSGYTIDAGMNISMDQVFLKGGVQAQGEEEAWTNSLGGEGFADGKEPTVSLQLENAPTGDDVKVLHKKSETEYEEAELVSFDSSTNTATFKAPGFSDYAIVSKSVNKPDSCETLKFKTPYARQYSEVESGVTKYKTEFTYENEFGEKVGTVTVVSDSAATLKSIKDSNDKFDHYELYIVSATYDITVAPESGYDGRLYEDGMYHPLPEGFILDQAQVYNKKGVTNTGSDQDYTTIVFNCCNTYSVVFKTPTLSYNDGTSEKTAITMDFDENPFPANEIGYNADDRIYISNFDSRYVGVRVTEEGDTTGWVQMLTPSTEDGKSYVHLGRLKNPNPSATIQFELVDTSASNEPNRPEGKEIRFDRAKGIVDGTTAGEFLVVYDGPEGDVTVKVTGESGDRVNKFIDGGTDGQTFSIFTTGGSLNLDFVDGDPVKAEWLDDDGQTAQPVIHTITPDASHKAVVDVPTAENVLRRVDISFLLPPRMFNVGVNGGGTGVTAKYDNEGTPATFPPDFLEIDEGRDIYLYGFDPLTMDVVLTEANPLNPLNLRVNAKMNVFRPEEAGEDDPYIVRVCDLKDDATIPDDVSNLMIAIRPREVKVSVRPGEGVADLRIDPQDNHRLLFETAGITQSFEAVLGPDRVPWSEETKHDEEGNEWTEYYITVAASQLNNVDYLTSVSAGDGFLRYFEGGDDSRDVELVGTNTQANSRMQLNDYTDEYAIEINVPMATLVFIPDDYMAKNTKPSQDKKKVVCSNGQLEAEFSFSIPDNGSDVLIPLEKRTIHKDQYNEWEHDEYYVDVLASKVDDINVVANLISNAGFFVDCEGQLISWGPQGYEPIASHYDAEHRFAAFNIHAILPPITETVTNDSIKVAAEEGYTFECTNLDIQGSTPITSDNGSFTELNPATRYSIVKAMKDGNDFIGYSSAVTVKTLGANDDSVVETKDADIREKGAVVKTDTKIDPDAPVGSVTGLDMRLIAAMEESGSITPEEDAAVAAGDDLTLTLIAENLDGEVPAEDRSAANAALAQITRDTGKKAVLGTAMDISLLLKVGDYAPRKLERSPSQIRFSVTVPNKMLNTNPKIKRTFYLLRFHENQAAVLASGTRPVLTGSSDLFSTYAIAYVDEEVKTPAPKPAVTPDVKVSYKSHIQNVGTEANYAVNGALSGTTGASRRLEGIWIKVEGNKNLGIQYTTHVQDYGWMGWSSNDEMSGTEGESKRLEAIKIQLTGADKDKYDVYYRVHAQNIGWMNWAKNGAAAGTAGYAYRLEAIQIVVVKKGASFDKNIGKISSVSADAYRDKNHGGEPNVSDAAVPNVTYRTHVQNVGWQAWKTNGAFAGTSGRSLRLEGIQMRLSNSDYAGGIRYKTHVQNDGWQDWRANGVMSGTSGRSLRLEAINVELTGEVAKHYDIYYRVHAQNYGWLGWAKNGESAGTSGQSLRLEGIQVVIVPKGSAAPGNTYKGVTADASKKAFYGK